MSWDWDHWSDSDLFDDRFPTHKESAFGFAPGHRVRVINDVGAHTGLTGVVDRVSGCSVGDHDAAEFYDAQTIERCRMICPNVRVAVTHRIGDDGAIHNDPIGGHITCPPGHLEHCD